MIHHDKKQARITIGQVVSWTNGTTGIPVEKQNKEAGNFWHDSRKVGKGDIFCALSGEENDGHAYIEAAFKAGAQTVIASRKRKKDVPEKYADRIIWVTDPLAALQRAAARYRKELGMLLVGITGSSGKTTTRNFISKVLMQGFSVGETFTNWNNHIGVPLSILRFTGDEWVGVIEMGANHTGEIDHLTRIALPDIAVITNIGYAHVGMFGSLANTTKAKFEIVNGLKGKNSFLLCNGDDRRVVAESKKTGVKSVYFGYSRNSVVVPESVVVDPEYGCRFKVDGSEFMMKMPGRHFIYSALPAIFIGRRCGIPDSFIAKALESIEPVSLRGTIEAIAGASVIVDCYNANPSSMESALVYLNDVAREGRKIAVLGEMLELGKFAPKLHRELGKKTAMSGVNKLVAVGPSARLIAAGAIGAGMAESDIVVCETADAVHPVLKKIIRKKDTILLKGSRGMKLETVYEKLKGAE